MRWSRQWWIVLCVGVVVGCAAPSATTDDRRPTTEDGEQEPTITAQHAPVATIEVSPTSSIEATTTTTVAPAFEVPEGWRLVWQRPGFTGAASVDLRAVGDVSLARHVEPVAYSHPAPWMLEEVTHLLDGDVVLGNLESPFTARRGVSLRPGPYRLPADPALADRLAPFTALSLANNHALDAGAEGLTEARATLQEHGIAALGTAGSCPASPFVTDTTPRLHVLAFNAVRDPEDRAGEAEGCGRAWLDDDALDQIASLQHTTDDPVVVLVHWGDEYAPRENAAQQQWARRLVGAGADLVLGAHPHVMQPMESLVQDGRRGFVAYSLGNFMFDQPNDPATSHSDVLRAWLDADGVGAVAVAPIAIVNGRPRPGGTRDHRPPEMTADNQQTAPSSVSSRTPSPQSPTPSAALRAWRWNGLTFQPYAVPPDTVLPLPAQELEVDLHGDGEPLRATLTGGVVQVRDGAEVVWQNESPAWNVAGMDAGDVDNDGRFEVLLHLWKPDQEGVLRSHPFLMGWRGGYYRIFWGGSAVKRPIQDAAIGAVMGSRNMLVVLDGGTAPDEGADRVAVFAYQDWQFVQQWHSESGQYERVALLDLDGDGVREIVVR